MHGVERRSWLDANVLDFEDARTGELLTASGRVIAMIAALSAVACSAGPKCPADGGSPWRELRSSHFVLQTDAGEQEAVAVIQGLEISRDAIRLAFPGNAELRGVIDVVLFRDEAVFHQILPQGTQGRTRLPRYDALGDRPVIVDYLDGPHDPRVLIQHEVAHTFVHFHYPQAPTWLDEGLAEYLSTIVIEDGQLVVGRPVPFRAPPGRTAPLTDLLASTRDAFYRGSGLVYEAWSLVHLLRNGTDDHRAAFDRYLQGLARDEEPMAAWRTAFPAPLEATIAIEHEAYGRRRTLNVLRTRYEVPHEPGVAVLPMNDYEVHRSWARLYTSAAGVVAQVDEAIRQCPRCARLHAARARLYDLDGEHARADAEMAAAVELDALDPAVRFEILFRIVKWGRASPSSHPGVLVDDVVQSLSGLRDPSAQVLLAQFFEAAGDLDRATSFAEAAITLDANCGACFETYGAVLARRGRFSEAAKAQRRAIVLFGHSQEAAAQRQRLQEYEQQAIRARGDE